MRVLLLSIVISLVSSLVHAQETLRCTGDGKFKGKDYPVILEITLPTKMDGGLFFVGPDTAPVPVNDWGPAGIGKVRVIQALGQVEGERDLFVTYAEKGAIHAFYVNATHVSVIRLISAPDIEKPFVFYDSYIHWDRPASRGNCQRK